MDASYDAGPDAMTRSAPLFTPDATADEPFPTDSVVDFGDGSTTVHWSLEKQTLTVESLPPIDLTDAMGRGPLTCLHVTGIAGAHDEKPPVLVVVSLHQGEACGTMLGRSSVYRFDGHSWTHPVDTMACELRLREDGHEIVEWKLVSAEEAYNSAKWSRSPRAKFPPAPPVPRATDDRPFGFTVR